MFMSTVTQGHVDASDWCFLIAVILFLGLAVVAVTRSAWESVVQHVAFALVAAGLLLL